MYKEFYNSQILEEQLNFKSRQKIWLDTSLYNKDETSHVKKNLIIFTH